MPAPGTARGIVGDQGYFNLHFVGKTESEEGEESSTVLARARGNLDPNYAGTAKMVAEAALCLAFRGDELVRQGHPSGGCLTPATCMGTTLVSRFQSGDFLSLEILPAWMS
mmetsp:Transcript_8830/g.54361  ORF Transcript_8830/g.54361 Transcript_8830/m.54361 type:complete len:111 (+) Transcript_8830:407-739(+)